MHVSNDIENDRSWSLHNRVRFLFLNIGHFLDHLFMLVFATVAALHLTREWGMSYAELIPYATPGFIAFGVFAIPAGWLADKWSREGMMLIFFLGCGLAAVATSWAETPAQIAAGLFCIGVFAAIYHPVGIAMVIQGRRRTGVALAINGVFGNLGVACAALITGVVLDWADWRMAFVLPGTISVGLGLAYAWFLTRPRPMTDDVTSSKSKPTAAPAQSRRVSLRRVFAIIFFTTAIGGLIFQSTTFALPKVFDERIGELTTTASGIGGYTFIVFAIAAAGQLLVGYLLDNHRLRTVFIGVAALQAIFFLTMQALTGIWALLVAVGFMLVVFGQIPINDVLIGRVTRNEWRSRMLAMRYIVTFTVAATTVPFIAWVHLSHGFSVLFLILAVAASLIFAAVLALPRVGLEAE